MEKFLGCVITLVILAALDFLWAWVFEGLWNWLIPLIFHGPSLTYWEAFGVILLLSLVGGFFKSYSGSK